MGGGGEGMGENHKKGQDYIILRLSTSLALFSYTLTLSRVPEQALGWFPYGFGINWLWKMSLLKCMLATCLNL